MHARRLDAAAASLRVGRAPPVLHAACYVQRACMSARVVWLPPAHAAYHRSQVKATRAVTSRMLCRVALLLQFMRSACTQRQMRLTHTKVDGDALSG